MKTRNGFVSNSSSSSFIVVFDKKIEDYSDNDLKQKLFGTTEDTVNGDLDSDELLERVREEAMKVEPIPGGSFIVGKPVLSKLEYEEIIVFNKNYGRACKKANNLGFSNIKNWNAYWDKVSEIAEEDAKKEMMDFTKKNTGQYYHFTFSDNNGNIESFLEHEDIFNKFPHVVENNH